MANVNPFGPNFSKTKTLSVTSSSSSVTLDATDVAQSTTNAGTVGGATIMRVYNAGTAVAFIRWGVGAQTALTTDMPVAPGCIEVFGKSATTDTVAAITGTGTATVYITCGQGQ